MFPVFVSIHSLSHCRWARHSSDSQWADLSATHFLYEMSLCAGWNMAPHVPYPPLPLLPSSLFSYLQHVMALARMALMKEATLVMMVGSAADVMSLVGMMLTEPTLVLSARRMRMTTHPRLHNQVSTFNMWQLFVRCTVTVYSFFIVWRSCGVVCVHECVCMLVPLSAHWMLHSCHMSNVQICSLMMPIHTHIVSAIWVTRSMCASVLHSLCITAAVLAPLNPLSDLKGMRRVPTGE